MPSSIGEFLVALHRIVPPGRTADWDAVGLQLGDSSAPTATVGVCHEVTEAVVERLEESPVDLLITYHPLLFRPTTRLVAGRSPAGRAFRLVRAGVALAVAHTSFDAAAGGTADSLASALGLADTRPFAPVIPGGQVKLVTFVPENSVEAVASAMAAAGGGTIGNYSGCSYRSEGVGAFLPEQGSAPVLGSVGEVSREAEVRIEMIAPASSRDQVCAALVASHPYEEPAFDVYDVTSNLGFIGRVGNMPDAPTLGAFAERAADVLGSTGIRVSGDRSSTIRRVAVVPGSGGSFVAAARAAGADVFVTGDVGHHTVVQALDAGLAVVDVGHAPSERPGIAALERVVTEVTERSGGRFVEVGALDPTPWL